MSESSMSELVETLPNRLRALVPELEHGRQTHLDWGAYIDKHPEYLKEHPDFGDVDHQAEQVEEYNKRIRTVLEAAEALS